MSMQNNNTQSIMAGWLSLPEVIKIVTVAAVIYGQWVIMGNEVDTLTARADRNETRIDAVTTRQNLNDIEFRDLKVRYENLAEVVNDMRRQMNQSQRSSKP